MDNDMVYREIKKDESNLKSFIKDHKKEILIAGGSVLLMALFYNHYGVKINKKKINLTFLNKYDYERPSYGYLNLNLKNCTISDLGKAGQKLLERFPDLMSKTDTIDSLKINFNLYER